MARCTNSHDLITWRMASSCPRIGERSRMQLPSVPDAQQKSEPTLGALAQSDRARAVGDGQTVRCPDAHRATPL
eukprot:1816981-Alexandrium_andersonii.AAC.1